MPGPDLDPPRLQAVGTLIGDGHRAVLTASAAEGDGQATLPLTGIHGQALADEVDELLEKLLRRRPLQHVIRTRRILARKGTQFIHIERIGDEADIEHDICIDGRTVFIP